MNESTKEKLACVLQMKRALRLVWESAHWWTIVNAGLMVLQGCVPLALLYLMKLMVDSVSMSISATDKGEVFQRVAYYLILTGATTLFAALLGSIANVAKEQQTQAVTDHVNDILHAKSIEVDLEYYESAEYYDKLHRAQQEGPYRPASIVNGMSLTAQSAISLAAMVGLLISFHWWTAAIVFVAVIPGVLVQVRYAGRIYRWHREQTPTERQANYFNLVLTGDMFARELRLFGLGPLLIDRYKRLRRVLREERLKLTARRSMADLAAQAIGVIVVIGLYAYVAYRAVLGAITLGDMVMYFGAFQRGMGNLRQMLTGLASLYEDSLFLSSFYEFLDLRTKVIENPHPKPFPKVITEGIVFDRVSFQYPLDSARVLNDCSLEIKRGEVVALVGENGSGKTTLIKMLCRLYDPLAGAIRIDGIDLRDFETQTLRRQISVVFQDYMRYNVTARENIWFGNTELPQNDEAVVGSARISGAHEMIQKLKHNYETILGKWFEDGEELSVGEWQKMALARAFLRNAQIIILDEPTSSLDAKAEYELFKSFRHLSEGRTVILISHRFSTVRMANRIFVLENGTIIESGTHGELVCSGGKYASLFEKQAQYYR